MGNKRFHHTTPDVAHLKALVDSQNVVVIAKAFGVRPTSLAHWIRVGEAPHWTLLGAEALNRRMGKFADNHRNVIVAQVEAGDTEALTKIIGALGGTVEAVIPLA